MTQLAHSQASAHFSTAPGRLGAVLYEAISLLKLRMQTEIKNNLWPISQGY